MNGLEKFFESHKTGTVRHEPEFIGSVTQHIDQEPAEAGNLDLLITFGQKETLKRQLFKLLDYEGSDIFRSGQGGYRRVLRQKRS